MSGVFGAINCRDEDVACFQSAVDAVWPDMDWKVFGGAVVGGHSFQSAHPAVREQADGSCIAVDGDPAAFRLLTDHTPQNSDLLTRTDDSIALGKRFLGNLALADNHKGILYLAADWTGAFPLFYAKCNGGLLFGSLMQPIAAALGPQKDFLGMYEFLRYGYTLAGRTLFENVNRVLPGQLIVFKKATGTIHVSETSKLWTASETPFKNPNEASDAVWELLVNVVNDSCSSADNVGMMMSAGWDSRTLLAAELAGNRTSAVKGLIHGNPESREFRITRKICNFSKTPLIESPISADCYAPEYLAGQFARTEHLLFPYWHRSGDVLRGAGVTCGTAGVYGEVLGGHYGPTFALKGTRKRAAFFLRSMFGLSSGSDVKAARLLREKKRPKPFYFTDNHWDSQDDLADKVNGDITNAIARLRQRGVESEERLLEAFVSEHRATQYINGQPLSFRGVMDVTFPFCNRELLTMSARLPLSWRIYNRMNQRVLRRHAKGFLKFPTAAILAPCSTPLFFQEASRFVEQTYESFRWKRYLKSSGAGGSGRLGWGDFEFLRTDSCLFDIVEELQCDFWDKDSIRKYLQKFTEFRMTRNPYGVAKDIARLYSVDLMYR